MKNDGASKTLTRISSQQGEIILLKSLPNDKLIDKSKSKALADKKINVAEKLKLLLGRGENIVRKGENAGYYHFLLFPQCFQKASFIYRVVKSRDCVVRVNPFPNKAWFLRVCRISFMKTQWKKEKLLITSNFSFSHSVFYPFRNFTPTSSHLKSSPANFQFRRV